MDYKPQFPYTGKQIILNSDRIILNSKSDSIFLSAKQAVSLSSAGTINLDSDKETIINSPSIFLGLGADEPLVKGTKLKNLLTLLFDDLEGMGSVLSKAVDSSNNPIPQVQVSGDSLIRSIRRLKKLLKDINSNQNFTK